MNIPFPVLTPRLIDPKWFNADGPCDEEAEITALEQANQKWLNSIGQQYAKRAPLGKADPEPMEEEEADTDEDEGNDESDESEESHDEDEEDDVPTSYSPSRNNNELEPDSLDDLNDAQDLNASDQSALWPIQ